MNIKSAYKLIQTIIDSQENFIVIIENEKPTLMNKSFCTFFGVDSLEQYERDFGAFINSFIPHPSYFHQDKLQRGESWVESLLALNQKDRIVSMINIMNEPRAFEVNIDNTHEHYAVVSFKDISVDLIKCIMIENNVSIDQKTGSYNKDYFLHTSELLQEGARFNKKLVGLTLMKLMDSVDVATVVSHLKEVSRQNDMLVRYARDTLLMAYLVDSKENAELFSDKLEKVLSKDVQNKVGVVVLTENEKINSAVETLKKRLEERL